jgi:solute carrier family 25 folate transporter 32
LTYPHEVLRSRQQDIRGYDKTKVNLLNVIKGVNKKDGIRGFYAGFYVNLIKILPQNAILFVVYEYLRSHLSIKY